MSLGLLLFEVADLVQWDLMMRPGEVVRISPQALFRPAHHASMPHCGVVVAPFEEGAPIKTKFATKSINFTPDLAFMNPALASLRGTADKYKQQTIFEFSVTPLGTAHRQANALLRLEALHLTLYGNRHGKGNLMRAEGIPMVEIEKRGRRHTDQSLRRYEKGGRLAQQLGKLSPLLRAHAGRCAKLVDKVLRGFASPLGAP